MLNKLFTENKFSKYIRINFIGRPYELNRLVYDDNILITNDKEIKNIVKADNLFKGHQYIGGILSFFIIFGFILKPSIKLKKITKFSISLIPLISFFIYSYYTYWDLVRDIIKDTRAKQQGVYSITKDELIIQVNLSKDNHKKIQNQLNFSNSLNEVINYYFYK